MNQASRIIYARKSRTPTPSNNRTLESGRDCASLLNPPFIISLPGMVGSSIFKTPQFAAVIGLAFAAFLSVLIAVRWPGGAVAAILGFIPNAFAYILVYLHCNSKMKLLAVVLKLLFVCLFIIVNGSIEQMHELPGGASLDSDFSGPPYLLSSKTDAGGWFYRLRGLGEINDPNDFGRLIVCVIPMVFIFWRPRRTLRMIAPRLPFARVMPYAAGLAISLVLLMYIILRVTNLTH